MTGHRPTAEAAVKAVLELERAKARAVAAEDYLEAARLKEEMLRLRGVIEAAVPIAALLQKQQAPHGQSRRRRKRGAQRDSAHQVVPKAPVSPASSHLSVSANGGALPPSGCSSTPRVAGSPRCSAGGAATAPPPPSIVPPRLRRRSLTAMAPIVGPAQNTDGPVLLVRDDDGCWRCGMLDPEVGAVTYRDSRGRRRVAAAPGPSLPPASVHLDPGSAKGCEPASPAPTPATRRRCSACRAELARGAFSAAQWQRACRGRVAKCRECRLQHDAPKRKERPSENALAVASVSSGWQSPAPAGAPPPASGGSERTDDGRRLGGMPQSLSSHTLADSSPPSNAAGGGQSAPSLFSSCRADSVASVSSEGTSTSSWNQVSRCQRGHLYTHTDSLPPHAPTRCNVCCTPLEQAHGAHAYCATCRVVRCAACSAATAAADAAAAVARRRVSQMTVRAPAPLADESAVRAELVSTQEAVLSAARSLVGGDGPWGRLSVHDRLSVARAIQHSGCLSDAAAGAPVQCRFNGIWYPGTVGRRNPDGTYMIYWNTDGAFTDNVPRMQVRACYPATEPAYEKLPEELRQRIDAAASPRPTPVVKPAAPPHCFPPHISLAGGGMLLRVPAPDEVIAVAAISPTRRDRSTRRRRPASQPGRGAEQRRSSRRRRGSTPPERRLKGGRARDRPWHLAG
eukprot:TRINITY_DN3185_c5_g1_i1.p1 TRINITY_DN3185_c5_g1~~TRINITY_DN3185_c5_g1_i1.p1  ORF type:complete len:682 (+),score=165.09 TRINITY_DN3185_c5_g1_i1:248-2293(+)